MPARDSLRESIVRLNRTGYFFRSGMETAENRQRPAKFNRQNDYFTVET